MNIDTICNLFIQLIAQIKTNALHRLTNQLPTQLTTNLFNAINNNIINKIMHSPLTKQAITMMITFACSYICAPTFTINVMRLWLKFLSITTPLIATINIGLLSIDTGATIVDYIILEILAQIEKLSNVVKNSLNLYNKIRNFFIKQPSATEVMQNILSNGNFADIVQEAAKDPNTLVSHEFTEQQCSNNANGCLGTATFTVKQQKNQSPLLFSLVPQIQVKQQLQQAQDVNCNFQQIANNEHIIQILRCVSV